MPGQLTSTQYFRGLITLHSALISGQVMFAVIGYVVKGMGSIPNSDDLVGIAELSLKTADITAAANGSVVVKNILLTGDGGQYRLRFEMSK